MDISHAEKFTLHLEGARKMFKIYRWYLLTWKIILIDERGLKDGKREKQ